MLRHIVPRYDIDVDPTVPPTATFWVPSPDELEENGGIGDFHDTELIVTDLEEAGAVIEAEREAVQYLDAKSSTTREFDDLAAAIEWEAPDTPSDEAPDFFDQEDAWYGLNGLEVGVAGLVYAMNAVGIITAASCRSHHQGHRPWADYPTVVFAANRPQVGVLRRLVESAGCGFEIDDVDRPRFLAIVAPSVVEMMALSRSVLVAGAGPFDSE
ncbi:hypothetical protein AB0230_08785 [Microbacterium sp. NPDC089190]|uniref:hypothetical protein n=1 Tax=Microbacterium sp. NPDC089190 TaxID=3155063 RepID=UPI00344CBCEF